MSDHKLKKNTHEKREKELKSDKEIKYKDEDIRISNNEDKNRNSRISSLLRYFPDISQPKNISREPKKNNLQQTILLLREKIINNDDYLIKIAYPEMLLDSLEELNNMIGMENLKNAVSLQVVRLIDALNSNENSVGMLNTIIYGPPGVGKTKIGIILAKIWFSLGFFEERKKNESNWKDTLTSIPPESLNAVFFISILVISYTWSATKNIYKAKGAKWTASFIIISILIIALMLWYWSDDIKDMSGISDKITDKNSTKKSNSESFDRKIISVVSRSDFVAEYVGHTAIKTKKLLQKNLGKVVMIDEAYSLLNDGRDSFGMEALTAINLFMSENENKIAIIFAGYKDLMQKGIFTKQPGLPRRCMWHFECDEYDGKQLGEIFIYQLESKGWEIENKDKIMSLINENKDKFPSFGGDTERLISFAQMAVSQNNFYSSYNINDSFGSFHENEKNIRRKFLRYQDIEKGLELLSNNNIHQDDNLKKNNVNQIDILRDFLKEKKSTF